MSLLYGICIVPTPLVRCAVCFTVHRPCCMVCNREKGMGAPPGAMTIKSSQFQGLLNLLQGHYRTQGGAFVEQSNHGTLIFLLSKVSPVVQSSIPVQ